MKRQMTPAWAQFRAWINLHNSEPGLYVGTAFPGTHNIIMKYLIYKGCYSVSVTHQLIALTRHEKDLTKTIEFHPLPWWVNRFMQIGINRYGGSLTKEDCLEILRKIARESSTSALKANRIEWTK